MGLKLLRLAATLLSPGASARGRAECGPAGDGAPPVGGPVVRAPPGRAPRLRPRLAPLRRGARGGVHGPPARRRLRQRRRRRGPQVPGGAHGPARPWRLHPPRPAPRRPPPSPGLRPQPARARRLPTGLLLRHGLLGQLLRAPARGPPPPAGRLLRRRVPHCAPQPAPRLRARRLRLHRLGPRAPLPLAPPVAWGSLKYFVPALEWVPHYGLDKFKFDLLSGLTIASLAIPQGISYAGLANLPPVIGLYSSFVPPLLYAVFGSSNNLAVGTVAAASLLLASIIEGEVSPEDNPELYLQLFYTSAFFTGVFQTALGVFRLGLIVDFLSRSTITGFMGGTAMIIIMQQLKGLLGMKHFTPKTDLISVLGSIFKYRHEWRWQSALLGICFILFLLSSKHLRKKMPNLFWVSAIAPFMVVVIGGVFDFLVHGDEHGIPIVGDLKKGINPISISQLKFDGKHVGIAVKAGLLSGILALAEGIAVGRSLAMIKNEQIDGNKEMIAFGMMNIVGSFTSCYLTTGPFSKSAVNFDAGCKTPMSNVVMSVCILLVLLFLAPLFKYTPLVALSSIIIVAMIGLIKVKEFIHLYRIDKFDFCICMVAFLGVIFFTMVIGLSASVGLSVLRALLYVARPATFKLGTIRGTEVFRDVKQYPNAKSVPNILVLQLGSPIYFVNAGYLRERILRWVEDEEHICKGHGQDLQCLVLDLGGVTSIDNTGIGMLGEVHKSLGRKGIKIALANPGLQVTEKLVISGYIKDTVGEESVFLTITEAITSCRYELQMFRSKEGGSEV